MGQITSSRHPYDWRHVLKRIAVFCCMIGGALALQLALHATS